MTTEATEHTPEELAEIKKLDDELRFRVTEFAEDGGGGLLRISELIRELDRLRPERRGKQYRPSVTDRMAAAASNFFNEP
jgi:hypothetical protein